MVNLLIQITLYIYNNTNPHYYTMNTDELQSYFASQAKKDRDETQGLSSLIDTLQTQDDYKKCYKPYRTLRNY